MRTLIIGATGHAGYATGQRLLKAGHEVTGLARNEAAEKKLSDGGVRVAKGDLTSPDSIISLLPQFDWIVFTPRIDITSEFEVVRKMFDALEGTGKRFIFTSGTNVLATKTDGDWDENSYAEDDPFPPSPHSGARIATEDFVRTGAQRGIHGMVIRPPIIWGPGGIARSIMAMHASARTGAICYLGRGLGMTSNIHVDDLAEIFALALERGVDGALYHAVSGEQCRRVLAMEIARLRGLPTRSITVAESEEIYGKVDTHLVISTCNRTRCPRTRKDLGWKPHPDRLDFFAECARPIYMANTGERNRDLERNFHASMAKAGAV
jgi:nucleoside-diphosphate-sugar epimerase